jgi:hypothetical protein
MKITKKYLHKVLNEEIKKTIQERMLPDLDPLQPGQNPYDDAGSATSLKDPEIAEIQVMAAAIAEHLFKVVPKSPAEWSPLEETSHVLTMVCIKLGIPYAKWHRGPDETSPADKALEDFMRGRSSGYDDAESDDQGPVDLSPAPAAKPGLYSPTPGSGTPSPHRR